MSTRESGSADEISRDAPESCPEDNDRLIGTSLPDKKFLHDAIVGNDGWAVALETVRSLLSAGASPDDVDEYGTPPLLLAINYQGDSMLQQIIDAGANLDAPDSKGNTGLHQLILKRNRFRDRGLGCMKLLLSAGASPNIKNAEGDTPLTLAVKKGEQDLVRYLINSGANVELMRSQSSPGLRMAFPEVFLQKDCQTLRTLLKAGLSPNYIDLIGDTPLTLAVITGQIELVQQLIGAGADVNYHNVDDAQELIDAGADIKYYDIDDIVDLADDIENAPRHGFDRVAMMGLIKSPLHFAAHEGHIEILKLLLERGADPNRANTRRYSVLSTATRAKRNRIPILNLLLDNGADMYISNATFDRIYDEINPLPFEGMLENNDLEGVKLFLDRGFDLSKFRLPNGSITSPLRVASEIGYKVAPGPEFSWKADTKMLLFLFDYFKAKGTLSSELERSDEQGRTPLFYAITGRYKHAALLLKAGANPNHEDNGGRNALAHVLFSGAGLYSHGIRMLIAAGAEVGNLIEKLLDRENADDGPCNPYSDDESSESDECEESCDIVSEISRLPWQRPNSRAVKRALCIVKFTALYESRLSGMTPIRDKIQNVPTLRNYYDNCKAEVAYSKNCQFINGITYYDILTDENFWKRVKFLEAAFLKGRRPDFDGQPFRTIRFYSYHFQDRWITADRIYKLWKCAVKGLEVLLGWDKVTYYQIFDNILDRLNSDDWRSLKELAEVPQHSATRSKIRRLR